MIKEGMVLSELLKEYLTTIRDIKDCQIIGFNPYELNEKRIDLHYKIIKCLGLKEDTYLRLKTFTDNLDKVCEIYSACEEWKLKTSRDINMLAKDLERFLTSAEAMNYLEGKTNWTKW